MANQEMNAQGQDNANVNANTAQNNAVAKSTPQDKAGVTATQEQTSQKPIAKGSANIVSGKSIRRAKLGKVLVSVHPETGEVFNETSDPDTLQYVVECTKLVRAGKNTRFEKRTAINFVEREQAQDIADVMNLKPDAVQQGTIIRKTSLEPFYEGQEPVLYPENSERAGEIVLHKEHGMPYYQDFEWVDDENAQDINDMPSVAELKNADLGENSIF